VALANAKGVTAFEPEPFTGADAEALEERLGREVRSTASMLHQQGACSYVESEELAASLLAGISRTDMLQGTLKTRVHGDYHLGQVLRTSDDFVIIDFEGEPSRTMDERRQKSSPLKDVAGMLRSIDYAVATALAGENPAKSRTDTLTWWRDTAGDAFISGYLSIVNNPSTSLVPSSEESFKLALNLFMIEKATYEVRYELDNRPDWLEIPFGALKRIGGDA
jgi:maltose alpha-D-glucosyltransferase/alpha-amylase